MSHFRRVYDLNGEMRESLVFSGISEAHACRHIGVRPIDRISSVEELRPYRRAIRGDHYARDFSCASQFRCMAFANVLERVNTSAPDSSSVRIWKSPEPSTNKSRTAC